MAEWDDLEGEITLQNLREDSIIYQNITSFTFRKDSDMCFFDKTLRVFYIVIAIASFIIKVSYETP